jgi:hypothetical protein
VGRPGPLAWRGVGPASPSAVGPNSGDAQPHDGWLVGLAVGPAEHDAQSKTTPAGLPPNAQPEVRLLDSTDAFASLSLGRGGTEGSLLTEYTMSRLKAAADCLLPVLGQHFPEAYLMLGPGCSEIVCTFDLLRRRRAGPVVKDLVVWLRNKGKRWRGVVRSPWRGHA